MLPASGLNPQKPQWHLRRWWRVYSALVWEVPSSTFAEYSPWHPTNQFAQLPNAFSPSEDQKSQPRRFQDSVGSAAYLHASPPSQDHGGCWGDHQWKRCGSGSCNPRCQRPKPSNLPHPFHLQPLTLVKSQKRQMMSCHLSWSECWKN